MSLFKNRSTPVPEPPRYNALTGRRVGSPASDPVDEEARTAGALAMLTLELPDVRRARVEKEARAYEVAKQEREERDWYARYNRDRRSGALTRD